MKRTGDTTIIPKPRKKSKPSSINVLELIRDKDYAEAYMVICMGSYANLKDRKFLILEVEGTCPYH